MAGRQWNFRHFLIFLLVLVLFPLLLLEGYSGWRQREQHFQTLENHIQSLASLYLLLEKEDAERTHSLLEYLAEQPEIRNLDVQDATKMLKQVHNRFARYSTLVLVSPRGELLASSLDFRKSVNVADRFWFQEVLKRRSFVKGNFVISRTAFIPSLPFALPFFDDSGRMLGIVGAAMNLESYTSFFARAGLPEGTALSLTDRTRRVLYSSVPDILNVGRRLPRHCPHSRTGVPDGWHVGTLAGNEYYCLGQPADKDDPWLFLQVRIPVQVLDGPVVLEVFFRSGLLFLVLLGVAWLAVYLKARLEVIPVRDIVKATEILSEGGKASLPRYVLREMDQLARAVEDMGQRVHLREQERNQALDRLQKSERHFRTMIDFAGDGILVADSNGNLVEVNQAVVKRLGYRKEELIGQPVSFISPNLDMTEWGVRWGARSDGFKTTLEASHRCRSGEVFPVELSVVVIDSGEDRLVMAVARDISLRKRTEEELRRASEEAEQANRSKSAFVANISHELRTPLTGVLGMLKLLQELNPTKEQLHYIDLGISSGNNLLRLINELLDLSKIEAGKLELTPEDFDMEHVVEEVGNSLMPIAEEKDVCFSWYVHDAVLGGWHHDANRIRQILYNLAFNAIKFTEHGRVDLEVYPRGETSDGVQLLFVLSDTGIGIPESLQHRVFDAFTRGDEKAGRRFQGTGLGLNIVKSLVDLMQGEIGLESEEGDGTTVSLCLTLPRAEGVVVKGRIAAPGDDMPAAGGYSVLVVEDNIVNQTFLSTMLKRRRYDVTVASDGPSALDILGQESFDLVLMDIQLPGMDGTEVTARIRGGEALNPEVPIIALTAHAMKGDSETFLAAGMDGYLPKPVDMQALVRIIQDFGG